MYWDKQCNTEYRKCAASRCYQTLGYAVWLGKYGISGNTVLLMKPSPFGRAKFLRLPPSVELQKRWFRMYVRKNVSMRAEQCLKCELVHAKRSSGNREDRSKNLQFTHCKEDQQVYKEKIANRLGHSLHHHYFDIAQHQVQSHQNPSLFLRLLQCTTMS